MPPQKAQVAVALGFFPGLLTHGNDHVIRSAQLLLHVIHSCEDLGPLGPMVLIVEVLPAQEGNKKGKKSSSLWILNILKAYWACWMFEPHHETLVPFEEMLTLKVPVTAKSLLFQWSLDQKARSQAPPQRNPTSWRSWRRKKLDEALSITEQQTTSTLPVRLFSSSPSGSTTASSCEGRWTNLAWHFWIRSRVAKPSQQTCEQTLNYVELQFNSNGIGMFLCASQPRSIRSIRSIAIEHLFEFPASLVATSNCSLATDVACRHWKHLQLSSIDWFQMISGTCYREPLNECTNLGGFPHTFPAILRFPSYQILLSDSDTLQKSITIITIWGCTMTWTAQAENRFPPICSPGDTVTVMSPGLCCYSILFHRPSICQHWSTLHSCHLDLMPVTTQYLSPRLSDGIDHPTGIFIHTAQFLDQKKTQQKSKHLSRNGHAQIGDVGRSVPHHYWHRWGD